MSYSPQRRLTYLFPASSNRCNRPLFTIGRTMGGLGCCAVAFTLLGAKFWHRDTDGLVRVLHKKLNPFPTDRRFAVAAMFFTIIGTLVVIIAGIVDIGQCCKFECCCSAYLLPPAEGNETRTEVWKSDTPCGLDYAGIDILEGTMGFVSGVVTIVRPDLLLDAGCACFGLFHLTGNVYDSIQGKPAWKMESIFGLAASLIIPLFFRQVYYNLGKEVDALREYINVVDCARCSGNVL